MKTCVTHKSSGLLLRCMCGGVEFTCLVYDSTEPCEYEMTYFIKKTVSECVFILIMGRGKGASQIHLNKNNTVMYGWMHV